MSLLRLPVHTLQTSLILGPAETRHLHVRRLRVGDSLLVFDGQGQEAAAVITELGDTRARLTLGERVVSTLETPQPLTLAIALLKADKLADVVRAASELGAARIQLLVTARADAREIGEQKLQRLRRIAAEASKQSRRAVIPQVLSPIALPAYRWDGQLFVAQPGSSARITDQLGWEQPVAVLTGPEGGLTDQEMAILLAQGAQAVTLGPRILRAETAPIAMLGAIAALGQ